MTFEIEVPMGDGEITAVLNGAGMRIAAHAAEFGGAPVDVKCRQITPGRWHVEARLDENLLRESAPPRRRR